MRAIAPQHQQGLLSRAEISLPRTEDSTSSRIERPAIVWSWIVVTLFGLFQAMAARFYMNPDGISYADLADAYVRGDLHNALSACWSPLYPILLSIAFRIAHPSPYFEAIAIHLLNFFLYLICFATLQVFIFEVSALRAFQSGNAGVRFTRAGLLVLGTIVFLTATQHYLPLSLVTPDLCVVAVALVASTMIVRLEYLAVNNKRLVVLGLVLGIGYLAKAAFFPIAFAFMAAAVARRTGYHRVLAHCAVLLGAFLVVAGPNIRAVSKIVHSITFADTGRLNYLLFVNGTSLIHFEIPGNAQGSPAHPTRKIFENPNVYEFGTPIGGTYPVWLNPSYWNEGISPKFDIGQQLNAIRVTSYAYNAIFAKVSALFFGWLFLAILQHRSGSSLRRNFLESWRILLPPLAGLAVYWPVYVEGRYIAGFILIIVIALYSSVDLPDYRVSRNVLSTTVIVLGLTTLISLYPSFHSSIEASFQSLPNEQWEVAKALHQDFGLRDGDSVGCIGNCIFSYWARLGRLRIVTEIPNRQARLFRGSTPSAQFAALRSMAAAGAKVAVTTGYVGNNWRQIGQTDYYLYELRPDGKTQAP